MQNPTRLDDRLAAPTPGRSRARGLSSPSVAAAVGVILLALFAGLTAIALRDHLFVPAMDRQLTRFCEWVLPGSLPSVATYVASFAAVVNMFIVTAVMMAWLAAKRRWPSMLLVACGFAAVLVIEAAIRIHPGHLPASPADVFNLIAGRGGWSETYPSGHTARIGLAAALYPAVVSRRVRPSVVAAAIVLGIVVGIERVQSGAHSGDEAIGGLLLGWGVASLALAALPAILRREQPRRALAREPAGGVA
jgi:membrane-associated phospholipid phosphatase